MRRTAVLAAFVALGLTPMTQAQDNPASETTKLAMAAAYKALASCSAYFGAGQTMAEIEANELTGIFPDFVPYMAQVSGLDIDEINKTMLVAFDGRLPPRAAVWRQGIGCSLLPVGASPDMTAWLPSFNNMPSLDAPDNSTALGDDVTITENTFALDL